MQQRFHWATAVWCLIGITDRAFTISAASKADAGDYRVSENAKLVVDTRVRPGSVDLSFDAGAGPDGPISSIGLLADDHIIVAGSFRSFAGQLLPGIARLNRDGSMDVDFGPKTVSPPVITQILVQKNGGIIVGGSFTNIGGAARRGLARLLTNGSVDIEFDPDANAFRLLGLDAADRILVAGPASAPVLRLLGNGGLDPAFAPPVLETRGERGSFTSDAVPNVLAAASQPNGETTLVYQLSYFEQRAQQFLIDTRFARIAPDGRVLADSLIDPTVLSTVTEAKGLLDGSIILRTISSGFNPTSYCQTLHVQPGGLTTRLTVCDWPAAGYRDGRFIAGTNRLGPNNDLLDTLSFSASGVRAAELQNDGRLLLGGQFEDINGVTRHSIARLLFDTNSGPPAITFYTPPQTISERDPALLAVQTASLEPVTFQWRHGADAIVGATNSALLFASMQVADAGDYSVIVSNTSGSTTSPNMLLNVIAGAPPEILMQPASQTLTEGDTAILIVQALRFPPFAYSWEFGGVKLPSGTNATLYISPVLSSGAGEYRVRVSNDFGSSTSQIATLTVQKRSATPGDYDLSLFPGNDFDGAVDSVASQPDGKILISGAFTRLAGRERYLVARLNADGSLDDNFYLNRSTAPLAWRRISRALPMPDGSVAVQIISVDGSSNVFKLDPDGTPRSSFAVQPADRFAIQSDGRIVVGQGGRIRSTRFIDPGVILRLMSDGSPDLSFQNVSLENFPAVLLLSSLDDLVVRPDGKIVFAGQFTRPVAAFGQLNTNGTVDLNFEPKLFNSFSVEYMGSPGPSALSIEAKLLVVVRSNSSGVAANRIVRFRDDGSVDATFDQSLKTVGSGASINGIVTGSKGEILIWGTFNEIAGVPRARIARLHPDGTLDRSFDPSLPGGGTISSVAVRNEGVIVIGGDGIPGGNLLLMTPRELLNPRVNPSGFEVSLSTILGRTYSLEASEAAVRPIWKLLQNIAGDGTVQTLSDSSPSGVARFYRLRIL